MGLIGLNRFGESDRSSGSAEMVMRCPTCRKPVQEPAPGEPMGDFPFCSPRCKLVDLGRWLDGKYQIPVVDVDDNEDGDFPDPVRPPDDPLGPSNLR